MEGRRKEEETESSALIQKGPISCSLSFCPFCPRRHVPLLAPEVPPPLDPGIHPQAFFLIPGGQPQSHEVPSLLRCCDAVTLDIPSVSVLRCRKSGAEIKWDHEAVGKGVWKSREPAGLRVGVSPGGSPRLQRAASRKLLSPFLGLVGSSERRFPITCKRGGRGGQVFFRCQHRRLKPQRV